MKNKVRVISPEWKEFAFLCGMLIFLGGICVCAFAYTDSLDKLSPIPFCIVLFLEGIAVWRELNLSQEGVEVVYCGIFHRRIPWSEIERLELRKYRQKTFLLIERNGCAPYPKDAIFRVSDTLHALRNFGKLNEIALNYEKEKEQIKVIESFHPIANKPGTPKI